MSLSLLNFKIKVNHIKMHLKLHTYAIIRKSSAHMCVSNLPTSTIVSMKKKLKAYMHDMCHHPKAMHTLLQNDFPRQSKTIFRGGHLNCFQSKVTVNHDFWGRYNMPASVNQNKRTKKSPDSVNGSGPRAEPLAAAP
jgi:hypothetical protein